MPRAVSVRMSISCPSFLTRHVEKAICIIPSKNIMETKQTILTTYIEHLFHIKYCSLAWLTVKSKCRLKKVGLAIVFTSNRKLHHTFIPAADCYGKLLKLKHY